MQNDDDQKHESGAVDLPIRSPGHDEGGSVAPRIKVELRHIARRGELRRRIAMAKVRRAGFIWVGLPGVGVIWTMLGARMLAIGAPSLTVLVGGAVTVVGGVATLRHYLRSSRENVADLEWELADLGAAPETTAARRAIEPRAS